MSTRLPTQREYWLEYAVTALLLVISVVSLWVAIGTEEANRQMVAAASWPLLQFDTGNVDGNGRPHIVMSVANSGVGPAKVEEFNLIWNGKSYANVFQYLHACCGLDLARYKSLSYASRATSPLPTPILTHFIAGTVIRANESHNILDMLKASDNEALWDALNEARFKTQFSICYCSVFDECWHSDLKDLDPTRVESCRP